MIRKITSFSLLGTALLGLLPLGCQAGGVGDPCTPEDEYTANFAGYDPQEVNTESKSFQCETRLCLVNHFQGRVSCKYGQATPSDTAPATCHVPGDPKTPITAQVTPQLVKRQADAAVYCSCRCDGPDSNARYCKCPSGFACVHLRDELSIPGAKSQLAGSYCVRDGTEYNQTQLGTDCENTPTSPNYCGAADDNG